MNVGWIRFGSTSFESRPSTSLPQPSLGARLRAHRRGQLLARRVLDDVDPGPLADRVAQRHPPPRRREIDLVAVALDLRRAEHRLRDVGDQLLEPLGGVVVVGVGLVPLEHRELGVVLERDALVAEVLAQLVHPVDAADDAALQVELGRDPQVEVAVERVVVGHERPRERAAVDRLQHRRLDLDEPVSVEPAPSLGDHLRPLQEALPHLGVRDQVLLAMAVAQVSTSSRPWNLSGGGRRLFARSSQLGDPQRQLAAPRLERRARRPR